MSFRDRLYKIVLPLVIILASLIVMLVMIRFRSAPKKEVKTVIGVLAEVMTAEKKDYRVVVTATGTVQAGNAVTVTPQVSGRVLYVSPSFVAGGFFRKGDLLFEIEKVDYELKIERAKAALAEAELYLAREESNAQVARQEWERLQIKNRGNPNPLVLYGPQLKNARARVASARASLKGAKLDLKRTRVYAPFNCRVHSEKVDIGQYVKAGVGFGVVDGTDKAEIVIPISRDDLQWLKVPGYGSKKPGSAAAIKVTAGNKLYAREGRVVRSLGEVDKRGRMSRIIVSIDDPYGLKRRHKNGGPGLEIGMFVEVELKGTVLKGIIALPAGALRGNGKTVWVVDNKNRLRIKPVSIVRREREKVLIDGGLSGGERIVITSIPGAADGMKLRPVNKGPAT